MDLRTVVVIGTLAATAAAHPGAQAAGSPPATVASVDLDRYAGTWYEIARLPNWFQRNCAGDVTATYGVRSDGRIDVVNRCRRPDGQLDEAAGVARPAGEDKTGARLEVRFAPAFLSFLPFVWGDYWIVGLGPAYEWAVVGDPAREYLWILARTPSVGDAVLAQAVGVAKAQGFDVSRLVRTPQGR